MLWLIAILFFGIGDVVTTSIGLGIDGIYEAGPLTSVFIERYGLLSMVVVKIGVFCGYYALWRFAPRPYRAGIPLGLALLGVSVVCRNLFVKILALQM